MKIKSIFFSFLVNSIRAAVPALALVSGLQANSISNNIVYLEQGWDSVTRDTYNYTPQGSWLMPLNYYLALEQPDSTKLFNDPDHIEALRFLPPTPDGIGVNPHALPVGFAVDPTFDAEFQQNWMGLTCAACHANDITYQGVRMRIDGAPALGDFGSLLERLALATQQTVDDEAKFQRFAQRVLGTAASTAGAVAGLRQDLSNYNAWLANQAVRRHPPTPAGPGRVDAFGQILNQLLEDFAGVPENHRPPAAAVSYPFLWLRTDMEYVQWNALASSPIGRNGGEVMGVFGRVNFRNPDRPKYESTLLYRELDQLEDMLRSLQPPKWPSELFGAPNPQQVAQGRKLFEKYCVACHNTKYQERHFILTNRSNNYFGRWFIKVNATHYKDVGTDPYYIEETINRMAVPPADGSLDDEFHGLPVAPAALAFTTMVGNIVNYGLNSWGFTQLEKLDLNDYRFRPPSTPGGQPEVYAPLDPTLESLMGAPLNGIWATAPYLHNGSVPTLYDLLSHEDDRPETFYVGSREMDPVKVGFVSETSATPDPNWFLFDTSIPSNGKMGHNYPEYGLSEAQKWALIEFMKTL